VDTVLDFFKNNPDQVASVLGKLPGGLGEKLGGLGGMFGGGSEQS